VPAGDHYKEPTTAVLPAAGDVQAFGVAEPPKLYVGDALFDLIDGGAVQFFAHGFEWTAAGAYVTEGIRVGVEVYRMTSPAAARAIYEERGGAAAATAEVGEDSRLVGSAVEFLRGSFYVVVIPGTVEETGQQAAVDLARIIDGRLSR
jgi:hypothetical protein